MHRFGSIVGLGVIGLGGVADTGAGEIPSVVGGRLAVAGNGDGGLVDLAADEAAIHQGDGAGAGHHGFIGDGGHAAGGLGADIFQHTLGVGHVGAVLDVLAAQQPIHVAGVAERPGLAHADGGVRDGVDLIRESAGGHSAGHGEGRAHGGGGFQ